LTPTVNNIDFPIDVVYTWVDSDDPVWQQNHRQWSTRLRGTGIDDWKGRYTVHNFTDYELHQSIRLLNRNAPWIRTIFIVAARAQSCAWWRDISNIQVVYHDEIWPHPQELPNFNSFAIESVIHRIPGLSEHFLYIHDDFYILRPVHPWMFFTPDGRPISMAYPYTPPESESHSVYTTIYRQLAQTLGYSYILNQAHAPIALSIALLNDVERDNQWKQAIEWTRQHRFRSKQDTTLVSAAVNKNALVWKHPPFQYVACETLGSNIHRLVEERPTFIGVNNCQGNESMWTLASLFAQLKELP
jgi:hypothetical protein